MEIEAETGSTLRKVSNQGFTLVELLVAMAVFLLALTAIYSTFQVQYKSYLLQQQVAAMQQNLRAAMFYMQREIRMAGCDPTGNANAGIAAANSTSINFTEDTRGDADGSDPDGAIDDPNESIAYSLTGGNLVRNTGGGNQVVAQNIDALDLVYLDDASPPAVLNPGGTDVSVGNLSRIRSVEITIVAKTDRSVRPSKNNTVYYNQQNTQILGAQNDNFMRRRLTTSVKCRNMGL
jgi:type IV pilus assembly protein PilW